jgi:hypothetical protein
MLAELHSEGWRAGETMARKKSSAQTTTALPYKKERLGKIQDSGNAKGPRSIDEFSANQHPPPTAGDDKSNGAENFPLTKTRADAKYFPILSRVAEGLAL